MKPIHCTINRLIDFKQFEVKTLYKLEFYERGYWSIIYNAHSLDEAKEMLRNERPNAEYKRSKSTKKINPKKHFL
ncbi:MAG: hypothetical protein ACUZ8H_01520 [Candidatus Anammoxibacter sp.]